MCPAFFKTKDCLQFMEYPFERKSSGSSFQSSVVSGPSSVDNRVLMHHTMEKDSTDN